MQKQLEYLLNKYSVKEKAILAGDRTVVVGNKKLPLLPWRNERRFVELKNLVSGKEITGISVMRNLRIVHKNEDLFDEMYREFDIAQYVLGSDITEIFAIGDVKTAINIVAKTTDGYVCSFELSATLPSDADVVDKHEIIAQSGVACDRAADTQIPQDSIYIYSGKGKAKFTDVDAELFGLTVSECALVRSAFECAKTGLDLTYSVNRLNLLVDAAKKSLENTENVMVEG